MIYNVLLKIQNSISIVSISLSKNGFSIKINIYSIKNNIMAIIWQTTKVIAWLKKKN